MSESTIKEGDWKKIATVLMLDIESWCETGLENEKYAISCLEEIQKRAHDTFRNLEFTRIRYESINALTVFIEPPKDKK